VLKNAYFLENNSKNRLIAVDSQEGLGCGNMSKIASASGFYRRTSVGLTRLGAPPRKKGLC